MIDDKGNARICDFALSRIISGENDKENDEEMDYTGTPRYLAYELVTTERPLPTITSDIYALGCVGLDVCDHILSISVVYRYLNRLIVYLPSVSSCKSSEYSHNILCNCERHPSCDRNTYSRRYSRGPKGTMGCTPAMLGY
jgi:serine/threonine protein kinase